MMPAMSVSRLGSTAALLGGLVWVVAAFLAWGDDQVDGALHAVGLAFLLVASATLGYRLVATAPLWLRAVVTAATPALGAMVWLLLRDAFGPGSVSAVVGGLLLLLGGGIGWKQGREERPAPPVRGRRAAR